jgi:HSP20 family protein
MKLPSLAPYCARRDLAADDPFAGLQREMDRMFSEFARGFGAYPAPMVKTEAWTPRTDVRETKDWYEILVELPGVPEKDIECTVSDGILTIKGEREGEKEQKDKNTYLRECSYGSFYRAFQLPGDVQAEKIGASFANGVLTVRLPRQVGTNAAAKKIPIGGEPAVKKVA